MTLNLQIISAVIAIVVGGVLYWFFKRRDRERERGRAQAEAKKPSRARSQDSNKDAPALGEFEPPLIQDEIPLLEEPAQSAQTQGVGYDRGGDGVDDNATADEREEAVAEAQAAHTFAAATPTIETETETTQATGRSGDAAQPQRPFGGGDASETSGVQRAEQFHPRAVDGFERISQIDYWAKITGARDVGRETVLAIYREGAMDLTKPHSIHGLKEPERVWCNLEDEAEDSRFADLVVTVQLADRAGAISEREMNRFSALVSKLSEGTGREFRFMTTVDNAFTQADAIAEFIDYFDSIFVVNITPQGANRFQGAAIDRTAPRMGLERDTNRYYSRFKSVGKGRVTLYSLADRSETGRFDFDNMNFFSARGLIFFTKPAVNRSPGAVFAEMVDTAKAFASRIQGVVNSPNHDDLSQDDVETIRASIEQVAAEMERLGIPAGGDQATRLF